jgi:hypothetical protein
VRAGRRDIRRLLRGQVEAIAIAASLIHGSGNLRQCVAARKNGLSTVFGAWNVEGPWVERAKRRLKHFSCRGCAKAGQSRAVTTLHANGQPIDSPADHRRVKFAGRLQRCDRPVPAIGPRSAGDWRFEGRSSRIPQRGSRRAGHRFDPRPRAPELGVDDGSHRSCGFSSFTHRVKTRLCRRASVSVKSVVPITVFRLNPAILPESTAIHSKTDVHNLQNWRVAWPEQVRNAAILPETAAVHSEADLHNVKNSGPQYRGAAANDPSRKYRGCGRPAFDLKPFPIIPESPICRHGSPASRGPAFSRNPSRKCLDLPMCSRKSLLFCFISNETPPVRLERSQFPLRTSRTANRGCAAVGLHCSREMSRPVFIPAPSLSLSIPPFRGK